MSCANIQFDSSFSYVGYLMEYTYFVKFNWVSHINYNTCFKSGLHKFSKTLEKTSKF